MRALVILHPGFEEIEAVTPMDLLSRADVEVISASTTSERTVTGRSGITLEADAGLGDVAENLLDAVILPGGPGIKAIRNHALVCGLLQRQHAEGKWIACICAAPLLLQDSGILQSETSYTCHPSIEEELVGRAETDEVVVSGNIITARGAGNSLQFGLQIIEKLRNREQSEAIAASISYQNKTLPV